MSLAGTTVDPERPLIRHRNGRVVCGGCGGVAKVGWVRGYGEIALVTCAAAACQPNAEWSAAVRFEPAKHRR